MTVTVRFETITTERGYKRRIRVVRCACGREVWCDGFTNTCDCGRDYGPGGYELAPRSQWGEETGETANDILMAEAAGWPDND